MDEAATDIPFAFAGRLKQEVIAKSTGRNRIFPCIGKYVLLMQTLEEYLSGLRSVRVGRDRLREFSLRAVELGWFFRGHFE